MCVKDDAYVRESLPIAKKLGLRVDRLERPDAQRQFPQINFDGVQTLYYEHEAGYLKARHACQTVCEQFQQEGGKYLRAEVAPGAIRSGTLEQVALADGSRLAADQYVFACGPWLGRVFPEVVGQGIQPTRQEVYYFGPPSGDGSFEPGKFPVWIDFDERLFYGLPSIDRRGVKIADDTRGAAFDPTGGDRTPSLQGVDQARKFLARRFPRLRSAPLLEARVCQYENSPDGHFFVDRHPEAKNVWLVGGGSGHGFKLCPALGEHVAQCVLGSAQPEPMFSIARLAKLKSRTTQFGEHE
jgi:glycine/D-amino acid oxidase-like deaminating enzyme